MICILSPADYFVIFLASPAEYFLIFLNGRVLRDLIGGAPNNKNPSGEGLFVVGLGRFELPTPCLSSKCSKPTELKPRNRSQK